MFKYMNMRITFMLRIIVLAFSFYLCGFVIIICFFCQLDSLIGKEKREFQTISSPYNACWHYLFAQNSLAEISVLHKINHIKIEYCICEFVSNLSRIVHIWFRFKKNQIQTWKISRVFGHTNIVILLLYLPNF